MFTTWSPRSRAERLIALGRLILALVSLVAIYLDPTEPVIHAAQTYLLLAAYALFSIIATIVAWTAPASIVRFGVAIHTGDLLVYSLLVYLTDSPTSPFFAWFVFALFSSALRFGRRATIWTSVAAILIFIVMGATSLLLQPEQEFELNRFLIRAAYLAIVAALLVYLADYQSALQADLLSISIWPRSDPSSDFREVVADLLERATEIVLVPRAVLITREREGGGAWQEALWDRGRLELAPLPAGSLAEEQFDSFLSRDLSAREPMILAESAGRVTRTKRRGLSETMVKRHAIRSVLAIRLDGSSFEGWLLLLDRDDFTVEDLILGEALRHPVIAQIDSFLTARRAEQAAIATERVRLAQQLHDGLLQSMAGVVHYLEVVHRLLETDPESARKKVTEVQGLLMEDQQNLRMFLQQLTPPAFRADRDLTNQLYELAQRLRRQWGLKIDLRIQSLDRASPELRSEIYNLSSEALFNIVKHAEAETARLRLDTDENSVHLTIEDDGRGFPFAGHYTLEQLDEMMSGPLSIKRRVWSCGGNLVLDTRSGGTKLEIELPIERRTE